MISQTEFQSVGKGPSQCEKILNHLKESSGEWVAMPELYRVSGAMAVHSRIADLRAAGCQIEQKCERTPGSRTLRSFYKLVSQS